MNDGAKVFEVGAFVLDPSEVAMMCLDSALLLLPEKKKTARAALGSLSLIWEGV